MPFARKPCNRCCQYMRLLRTGEVVCYSGATSWWSVSDPLRLSRPKKMHSHRSWRQHKDVELISGIRRQHARRRSNLSAGTGSSNLPGTVAACACWLTSDAGLPALLFIRFLTLCEASANDDQGYEQAGGMFSTHLADPDVHPPQQLQMWYFLNPHGHACASRWHLNHPDHIRR